MRFTQLRNATAKICFGNQTLLLDPWLSDFRDDEELRQKIKERRFISRPVKELPMSPEEILEGVDAVLITHLHEDHFALDYLPLEMLLIAQNEADRQQLKQMGFKRVLTFDEDHLKLDDVSISRIDAVHGVNSETLQRAGKASGYVLESGDESPLYLAGDTVLTPSVQETIDSFKPGVVVVNGSDARIRAGRLIMNKPEILSLAKNNPDLEMIVSHMEGTSHAFLGRDELRCSIADEGLEDRVLVPEDGETIIKE